MLSHCLYLLMDILIRQCHELPELKDVPSNLSMAYIQLNHPSRTTICLVYYLSYVLNITRIPCYALPA